ncbi:Hsp20/alpha crystallin family protein [Actinomadura barringtoniae]|uniref:Hsp20/alpha crystallin family protein n=1 Tax=Actinomadura barringtoniae TaxID=1427535 RepID=A0A939PRU2_9ACTN|nr:Hsp20/alpha crystallin family protein [Actinomadura barringtoniae]MBO2455069.1 Hsp20/alpha crystallin family protein [Actinomadura barringtoniae]
MPTPRLVPSRWLLRRMARSAPVSRLRMAGRPIRAEEYVEDGVYVVRADLPGVDPARDIEVSILPDPDSVEIKAIRRDDLKAHRHGEISYGLFRRVLTLPDRADRATLTTSYSNGVLEVAVDLPGARQKATATPIRR